MLACFNVLTVCTGNISRSPAAELLLASSLGPDAGVAVTSAGTHAPDGWPIATPVSNLLQAMGIASDGHRSRLLTADMVREADLILAMTQEHRGQVASLVPAAVHRSFTLLEFARIALSVSESTGDTLRAPDLPAERLAALAALAPQFRGPGEPLDIEDPYGRDAPTNSRVFDEIRTAIASVVSSITL